MDNLIKKIIYVPKTIEANKRIHSDDTEWINIYYYVDRKRTQAKLNKNLATSKIPIRRNTFYKLSGLSGKDGVWDYYKILKKDIADNKTLDELAIINNLKNVERNKKQRSYWKGPKHQPNIKIKQGPIILHF